jgi:restriction endonuclease S subunit
VTQIKKGKISNIANINMGQSPTGDSYNKNCKGIPLINGPTEFTNRYPIKLQWTLKPTKLCKKGDILFCVRVSSTGRMNISDDTYCIGRGVAAISPIKNISESGYLEQCLNFIVSKMIKLTTGSTFPNIDKKTIADFPIKYHPLSEQRKIAEILSCWDRAIEKTDKVIEKNRTFQNALIAQFTITDKSLKNQQELHIGHIAEINPPLKDKILPAEMVTFLGMADLSEDSQIIQEQTRTYAEVKIGFTYFQSGDVLIPKITPCFENGKGAFLATLNHKHGFGSTEFHVLRAKEKKFQKLLYFISKSYVFRKYGESEMTGSAGQKRVPIDFIRNFKFRIPPEPRLGTFINLLNKNEECYKNLRMLQNALVEQKKGLMQVLLSRGLK